MARIYPQPDRDRIDNIEAYFEKRINELEDRLPKLEARVSRGFNDEALAKIEMLMRAIKRRRPGVCIPNGPRLDPSASFIEIDVFRFPNDEDLEKLREEMRDLTRDLECEWVVVTGHEENKCITIDGNLACKDASGYAMPCKGMNKLFPR